MKSRYFEDVTLLHQWCDFCVQVPVYSTFSRFELISLTAAYMVYLVSMQKTHTCLIVTIIKLFFSNNAIKYPVTGL